MSGCDYINRLFRFSNYRVRLGICPAFQIFMSDILFFHQAERVDVYLHNISIKMEPPRSHLACFGTWILYYVLKIMIMYLLSGFELELYSAHEYTYIFWSVHRYLDL